MVVENGAAEQRRAQILSAAAAAFLRRGFHGASMQDVCREAAMSPGSVYRYFRSKEDIIEALAERDQAESIELLETVRGRADAFDALAELTDETFARMTPSECALNVEVGAEAVRNPRVAAIVRRYTDEIAGTIADVLRDARERGRIEMDLDPEAVARILMATLDGVRMQRALDADLDMKTQAEVFRTMLRSVLRPRERRPSGTAE
ncbi:MAG: TetR/AcrR family transcriptional regulator [Chloroflexia bacterium]